MGSNHEKYRGGKPCDTLLLIRLAYTTAKRPVDPTLHMGTGRPIPGTLGIND